MLPVVGSDVGRPQRLRPHHCRRRRQRLEQQQQVDAPSWHCRVPQVGCGARCCTGGAAAAGRGDCEAEGGPVATPRAARAGWAGSQAQTLACVMSARCKPQQRCLFQRATPPTGRWRRRFRRRRPAAPVAPPLLPRAAGAWDMPALPVMLLGPWLVPSASLEEARDQQACRRAYSYPEHCFVLVQLQAATRRACCCAPSSMGQEPAS